MADQEYRSSLMSMRRREKETHHFTVSRPFCLHILRKYSADNPLRNAETTDLHTRR